jgi:chromosome segregation ATPase
MEDFDDYKDRQVIEDVMSNIASDRRKLIEALKIDREIDKLHQKLDDFVKEFRDMSQKEEAVIDEAVIPDQFQKSLKKLDNYRGKLDDFLQADYRVVKIRQELDYRVSELQRKRDKVEDLSEKKAKLEIKELQKEVEQARDKLESYRESSEYQELMELEDQLDRKQYQREQKMHEIESAMSRMERGLKKLLYEVENGDVSLEQGKDILKDIREGNADELLEKDPDKVDKALESAREALPDDLLGEKQQRKFSNGNEALHGFSDHRQKVSKLNHKIDSIRSEIEEHQAVEKEDDLERQIGELESDLKELKDERDNLEKRISDIRDDIEELKNSIADSLREGFDREVSVKRG